jgi:predicted nucleotidyltransferase
MSHSEDIMSRLRAMKPAFKDMGLKRVRVFGSVLNGQAKKESDIDLIVDFFETPGLLQFIHVKHELEDRLGCVVDMTMADGLHPLIRDNVLKEAHDV